MKPPEGWVKLNTDGSVDGDSGLACCGGVIRDAEGQWLRGFSKKIGTTTSFAAELWGLRIGLLICRNLNILGLVIELDAESIVNVLQKSSYAYNIISLILGDCRLLISHMQRTQIKHCFRQANHCTDSLARFSFSQTFDFLLFDTCGHD